MKRILTIILFSLSCSAFSQPPIRNMPSLSVFNCDTTMFKVSAGDFIQNKNRVEIIGCDTIIFGEMDKIIKFLIVQLYHTDSVKRAAEDILYTIKMNGCISDWKEFKRTTKAYRKIKGYQ